MAQIEHKQLSDILTEKQIKEVVRIANSTASSTERIQRFKDYFGTFAKELESKGIVADYLAYAVEAQVLNMGTSFETLVKQLHEANLN